MWCFLNLFDGKLSGSVRCAEVCDVCCDDVECDSSYIYNKMALYGFRDVGIILTCAKKNPEPGSGSSELQLPVKRRSAVFAWMSP